MKSTRLFLLLLVLALPRLSGAEPVDLLLIAADDATLQPLLTKVTAVQIETHAAWTFWTGKLAGKSVVLARSEGDPLNAVAVTTLAIRLHPPRLVAVYGTARAHDPALQPGDVVVSRAFAAFDGMVSPITAPEGGSKPLAWSKLAHPLMTAGERETYTDNFPADASASAIALKLPPVRGRVVAGVLGSSNQVNREVDRIAWLRTQWQTSTEDGESAHVAGCAALLGVPVVGFRVVAGTAAEAAAFALGFVEAWK